MNNQTGYELLLNDVLEQSGNENLQAAVLSDLLGQVRRRGRLQRVKRSAALVAVALVLLLAIWIQIPPVHRGIVSGPQRVSVIRSKPLAARSILRTKTDLVARFWTSSSSVAFVSTDPAWPAFHTLSDEELLSFFPREAAALVRYSSEDAQLILFAKDRAPNLLSP